MYPENPEEARVIACSMSRIQIVRGFPVDCQSGANKAEKRGPWPPGSLEIVNVDPGTKSFSTPAL